MWFGDLVTMRWWNGIWLNEAFATFMEIAACDAYRPDWERWTTFGLERTAAFETDSLASTRPVEYEVRSPADCEGMFDVLTYQKGGAAAAHARAVPRRGALPRRASATTCARTRTGTPRRATCGTRSRRPRGEPVRRIMDSWIWQPGYPLVSALGSTATSSCCASSASPSTPTTLDADVAPTTWLVPVHVRDGGDVETRAARRRRGARRRSPTRRPPVVVNAGGHGFYRVAYDDELRARLAGEVLGSLDTLERYNLVDDAWNDGRRRAPARRPTSSTFVEGFGGERELAVWQAIVDRPARPRPAARRRRLPGASRPRVARAASRRRSPSSASRPTARTT